MCGVHLVY